jgi:hypothetical protein
MLMVVIMVMLKVLLFALCAGAIIGVVFAVLILFPLTLYTIPYSLWIGSQNCIGKHLDKKKEKFFRTVRNATRLYKAKLTGREPIF